MHTRIFVYGTLKQGQSGDVSQYDPPPRFLGRGWVSGALFDLGHCPALVPDEAGSSVEGEVYEIDHGLFDSLDRWEQACGDFALTTLSVEVRGDRLPCLTY